MSEGALSHKAYTGSMQVSIEDNCLYGKVLLIDDLITYEGQTEEEVRVAFQESLITIFAPAPSSAWRQIRRPSAGRLGEWTSGWRGCGACAA